MSNTELKPCPFCGGEARIADRDVKYIFCCNCGASSITRHGGSIEQSIEEWNNRKPMEQIVERLEELSKINEEKYNICEEREEMTEALIRCGVAKGYSYSAEIVKKGGAE